MCKKVGNPHKKNVLFGKMTSQIWTFLESSGEPYSFGWEMVRDKDQKSWTIVGNLPISEVWEPCIQVFPVVNFSPFTVFHM